LAADPDARAGSRRRREAAVISSATVETPPFERAIQPSPRRRSVRDFVHASGRQSLVLGASKDPNAKITILLVSPESRRPVLAVKAPTTDPAAAAVETEWRVLSHLQTLPAGKLLETIPRPVEILDFEGRQAVVTTAVPGTSMTTSYFRPRHTRSSTRVAADFAAAGEWLTSFRHATAGDPSELELDGGVIDRLRHRFGGDDRLEADLERLAEIHAQLRRETVPRTAVHGDFWFGNLLVAGGRVTGVVDWEAGLASGEPTRDLARFALMYALYLGGPARPNRPVPGHPGIRVGAWGAVIEYALDGSGWFPELFREFLGDGLARLGASPTAWRGLALAAIAETAAFTDNVEFATCHLDLFRRIAHAQRAREEKQ